MPRYEHSIFYLCRFCRGIGKFNIYECSTKKALEKNKLPILFIHGTSDDFVPSRMSKENFEMCKTMKKLVLVDCVNHGLSFLTNKIRIQREIKDFLVKCEAWQMKIKG